MPPKRQSVKSSASATTAAVDLEAVKSRIVEAIDLEIDRFHQGFDQAEGTYSRPDDLGGLYTRGDND